MKLFTNRIVKYNSVEDSNPRLIEFDAADIKYIYPQGLKQSIAAGDEGDEVVSERNEAIEETSEGAVEKAIEQADQIIAKAESEAAMLLREAHERAETIQKQAYEDAEALREEVKKSTYEAVLPQAREEGYQAGFQAATEETQFICDNASALLGLAQRAVQVEYERNDEILLHLAVKIAERILRSVLTLEPGRLLDIIRALSLLPRERKGWRIHLSGRDAELMRTMQLEEQLQIPWVVDETLAQGDCYLECDEGLFDARLQSQLDKLEQVLKEEVLKNRGL